MLKIWTAFIIAPLLAWCSIVSSAEMNESTPTLDPNVKLPCDSGLADMSSLLDPPAGKHGFLHASYDGHFTFDDGTRMHFFGVNIARESIFCTREEIRNAVRTLARAGINIVRFHHFDEKDGIIASASPSEVKLDERKLDSLDYWIYELKRAGIYTYLDLLDYRQFRASEGVQNANALPRGSKPMAVFNRTLIRQQQAYARALLREHINRYTGLAYADDPAIAFVEVFDENGLLWHPWEWHTLPEPYRSYLQRHWNEWLKMRYRSTRALQRGWRGRDGEAIQRGESLERRSVLLPRFTNLRANRPLSQRERDGLRFAYELHKRYYATMTAFLRSIGVKAPITAVGNWKRWADLKAMSETLDFIAINFYFDHPTFPKGAWQPPFVFTNSNPLMCIDWNAFAPAVAFAKVHGKPLIVREWNYCFPNQWRSSGMLEAITYANLQAVDGLIAFTFDARCSPRPITAFDISCDPSRWGLMSILSYAFLKRCIAPYRQWTVIQLRDARVFSQAHRPNDASNIAFARGVVISFTDAPECAPPSCECTDAEHIGALKMNGVQYISRDYNDGCILVCTPQMVALGGLWKGKLSEWQRRLTKYGIRLRSMGENWRGVLAIVSLDGQPIVNSNRLCIKYVDSAANSNMRIGMEHTTSRVALWHFGQPPIIGNGRVGAPVELEVAAKWQLRIAQVSGTWEWLLNDMTASFYTDTKGVQFSCIYRRNEKSYAPSHAIAYSSQGIPSALAPVRNGAYVYPSKAAVVKLHWRERR